MTGCAPFLQGRAAMKKHLHTIVLAAAALLPRAVAAQQRPEALPQLAQELFMAENTYVQDRTEVQLTAHTRLAQGPHTRLLGEYGITDRLQVQAVSPELESGASSEEPEETTVGAAFAVLPNAAPVALTASVEVGLSSDAPPRWEPALVAAHGFGRLQLHGAVWTELAEGEQTLGGSLAALVDAGRLTPTLELVNEGDTGRFVVPGLFVHPNEHVELAVGAPLCVSCDKVADEARVMLTVDF